MTDRNQRFVEQKQTRHSNVADLRVLKLALQFAHTRIHMASSHPAM
jgi:hypothetical protein